MIRRCDWVKLDNQLYIDYHDKEWGVPVTEDKKLFEFIVLESAQAGLSWELILKKRTGYRDCFLNFNPHKVALMTHKDVTRLLENASIIRNRLKIEATIQNAKAFLAIKQEYASFSNYMWNWVNGEPVQNSWGKSREVPSQTELSTAISKDLKKRGFAFLGPTVWYAHMQAVGMVNDHTTDCYRHQEVLRIGKLLQM